MGTISVPMDMAGVNNGLQQMPTGQDPCVFHDKLDKEFMTVADGRVLAMSVCAWFSKTVSEVFA